MIPRFHRAVSAKTALPNTAWGSSGHIFSFVAPTAGIRAEIPGDSRQKATSNPSDVGLSVVVDLVQCNAGFARQIYQRQRVAKAYRMLAQVFDRFRFRNGAGARRGAK
jgi:hypothetical protein